MICRKKAEIVLIFIKTLDFFGRTSIIVLTFNIGGVGMISDEELLVKVEADEGLTVDEIKRYQKLVKPQKHVYGKWGTFKRKYLEDKGIDWTIANLPEYLHGVDRQGICTMFSMQSSCKIRCTNGRASLWKITADLPLYNTQSKKKYCTN